MIYYTLGFTILICVNHHTSGVTATNIPNVDDGNSTECEEMKKPGWSINSLANVTLDAWPWSCLNSRYTEITINEEISKFSPDIFDASAKGYIGYVQYYIDRTDVINYNEDGFTPIHLAIINGNLRVVKYFIIKLFGLVSINRSLWSIKTKNEFALTFPECAAFYGQMNILRYLLKEIDVYSTDYFKSNSEYYLRGLAFQAAIGGQHHILKYLIHERGFVVRSDDALLLSAAARGGNMDMLKYLLYEKNIKARNIQPLENDFSYLYLHHPDCFSPYDKCHNSSLVCNAARGGKLDAVVFFVETLNYTQFINRGEFTICSTDPFFAAVKNLPVIKYMMEEKNADYNVSEYISANENILNIAAKYGHLAVVKYLVEQKHMDVDLETYKGIADGYTQITFMTPLCDAIGMGRLDVVKYLAGERNASLNVVRGSNALIQASSKKNLEIVKYLVDDMKMKSRIDEIDDSNTTAVMEAAYYGQLNILKFLIDDRYANTTIVDSTSKTLLHLVAEKKNILFMFFSKEYMPTLKYLIEEKGMKVSARTTKNETVLDIARRTLKFEEKTLTYLSRKLEQES